MLRFFIKLCITIDLNKSQSVKDQANLVVNKLFGVLMKVRIDRANFL